MSFWDTILPHRLFINRALRSAANDLRSHIDANKKECDKVIAQCQSEIDAAKADKDKQFNCLKEEYISILSHDRIALGELQKAVIGYAHQYGEKQLIQLQKEKLVVQLQALHNRRIYISDQIALISDDIRILEQRKDVLTQKASIEDVVELIRLCGCSLECDESETPKSLLCKVNIAISESHDLPQASRNALIRLRSLIQERAEYLPVIQYISWMIAQRANLRRELAYERRDIRATETTLKQQVSTLNSKLNTLKSELLTSATQIRDFWAVPIANIYIRISQIEESLSSNYSENNRLHEEITHMQRMKSDDSIRWNRLWEDKNSVREAISQLKKDRCAQNDLKKQWNERRQAVLDLLKRNNIRLQSPNRPGITDEFRVLERERLALIRQVARIKASYQEELGQLSTAQDNQEIPIIQRIKTAEKNVQEKTTVRCTAQHNLDNCIARDHRPFFISIFSESPEVACARAELRNADIALVQAERALANLRLQYDNFIGAFEHQRDEIYKRRTRELSPHEQRIRDINRGIEFVQEKERRNNAWR